eukprot:1278759-Amphidinium_carterae.2
MDHASSFRAWNKMVKVGKHHYIHSVVTYVSVKSFGSASLRQKGNTRNLNIQMDYTCLSHR